MMKHCSACGGTFKNLTSKTPDGIAYSYSKCVTCGEEILGMKQLHDIAFKYRFLKKYHVKLTKWGLSLGMRIPKEVVQRYHLKDNAELILIPEEEGLRLVPSPT